MLLVSEMDLTMCTDLRSRFLQLGNQLLRGIVSTVFFSPSRENLIMMWFIVDTM